MSEIDDIINRLHIVWRDRPEMKDLTEIVLDLARVVRETEDQVRETRRVGDDSHMIPRHY